MTHTESSGTAAFASAPRDDAWPTRVLITGGSSGIGLGVARAFLSVGAQVGLVGRDARRLAAAAEQLATEQLATERPATERPATEQPAAQQPAAQQPAAHQPAAQQPGAHQPAADVETATDASGATQRIHTASADTADERSIGAAVDDLAEALGGLDAIVLAAGTDGEMGASVDEVTAAGFREVLEVNVLGTFLSVRAALPHLRRSRGASVTIIGSDSGFVAVPGMLAYNASKGALVQLTRALAVELFERDGIRVNSVCPSIVDTPMARRGLEVESFADAPYPVQSVDDVAWAVLSLASHRSRAINGVNLLSDYGYTGRSSFPA